MEDQQNKIGERTIFDIQEGWLTKRQYGETLTHILTGEEKG